MYICVNGVLQGLVSRPDGSPANGELIQLSAYNYENNMRYDRNFTTDTRGEFTFQLPPFGDKVNQFTINVSFIIFCSDFAIILSLNRSAFV